ncbi:MAG: helicase-exonuclease AddAB subunit AddA [Ruminococcus flavefaciens]|nr:helicase-exonuclease AddAB subunit AddA [Ruminococcus flavefaciens]MCM1361219.1 helicase-exonuclease AddAB subunit AddA [Clostridiales bacterium]MCM1435460.1 helicase-exonuclease AddAB subunit AddA [Ruminococcus flavefaciens]
MAWTQQQENAINARGSSVIVSAAAGSGKTSVLTERLAKLISDPDSGIRADRMVVVTFTNDAASEMKKRLDMNLRAMINEDPFNRHLLKQHTLLQNAKISTINSFCFELIRDNITDQGITSGFAILDESESKILKAQAMEELFDYYSENDYEKISFLYDRFCIKNERSLIEVIQLADNFLASVALREKWFEKAESEYNKKLSDSVYFDFLMGYVAKKLEKALCLADECLDMIKDIFPDIEGYAQAKKSFAIAEDDCDRISELFGIIKSGRFPSDDENERLLNFSDLPRVTAKTPCNAKLRDVYKAKRTKMKKTACESVSILKNVEGDFEESREVTSVLIEILKKYQEIIWSRKCEKNAISFDDGERLALEILAETDESERIIQSETAVRTAEYYDIIMIDEYQDSNNKQDLIFKLISKNYKHDSNGEPMYGDNAFLVGDVKQSIYRFRLANPRNFISTLKSSEPYSEESSCPNKAIFLNRNFRSSKMVIDSVNFIFSQIMTEQCGDIDYNENEMLYFGAKDYEPYNNECRTHISFINTDLDEISDDSSENEKKTSQQNIFQKKNPEAVYTAGKIAEMIKSGVPVITAGGKKRPCRPSDFCILVRANDYINVYAEELNKRGIPAKGSGEKGYLKSREIALLIDLLRIINNPLLDISMMAVMTSPMYMFSIQEMAFIKSLDNSRPIYSVLLEISQGEYSELCDMFFIERCKDFLSAVDSFRLDSVTMTIGELIGAIYDTTDFISVMQLYSDGEKKRANLRLLIQYAQNYENSAAAEGLGGLGGFLRHIDRVMENGDFSQGKTSAASGDYVSIQTHHGSKGLEYPFVFLAETSHEFMYDSKSVMCSDDGRIGYRLYDPKLLRKYKTFQQTMLSEEEKNNTKSEEMRLMYVAMTRAKQKLFINLKFGEKNRKSIKSNLEQCILCHGDISDAVKEAECFADWIWLSLIKADGFAEAAERLDLCSSEEISAVSENSESIFEFEFNEVKDTFIEESELIEAEAESDPKICRDINEMIHSDYDSSLSELPAKLSVTQITKKFENEKEEQFDFRLKRPKFLTSASRLTGAERGTAIHTFFQYCDFDNAKEDPEYEIVHMTEMGYINQAQADSINIKNVAAFFDSELYLRMISAKNVWREKKFMVAVAQLEIENELMELLKKSDGMIKGIVDLMFEEEDGIVIVDYKSDHGVSAERLAERYNVQLRLYKSAIEITAKKRVKEAFLYSFELRKVIPIKLM